MNVASFYQGPRFRAAILFLIAQLSAVSVRADEPAAKFDFAHRVLPILKTHCVECHGGRRHEGDFSMNTRESILDAGAVEPGNAENSHLIELVSSDDKDERMPKDKPPLSMPKTLKHFANGSTPACHGKPVLHWQGLITNRHCGHADRSCHRPSMEGRIRSIELWTPTSRNINLRDRRRSMMRHSCAA